MIIHRLPYAMGIWLKIFLLVAAGYLYLILFIRVLSGNATVYMQL